MAALFATTSREPTSPVNGLLAIGRGARRPPLAGPDLVITQSRLIVVNSNSEDFRKLRPMQRPGIDLRENDQSCTDQEN
jgi:hypothetical protein